MVRALFFGVGVRVRRRILMTTTAVMMMAMLHEGLRADLTAAGPERRGLEACKPIQSPTLQPLGVRIASCRSKAKAQSNRIDQPRQQQQEAGRHAPVHRRRSLFARKRASKRNPNGSLAHFPSHPAPTISSKGTFIYGGGCCARGAVGDRIDGVLGGKQATLRALVAFTHS